MNGIYKSSNGWSRELVGEYVNGKIYKCSSGWSRELVGKYDNGIIYKCSSGWSRELVGECDSFIGASALILIFEQNTDSSFQNIPPNKVVSSSTNNVGCSGTILLQGLGILFGIFLACYLSYTMYGVLFEGDGSWAYYAMFFTAICSTIATNIYARVTYAKCSNKQEYSKNILNNGMTFFCTINILIAYIIYIIEMIITGKFNFWHIILGFFVSIFDITIFAIPFLAVEFIVLFIVKICTKNRQ